MLSPSRITSSTRSDPMVLGTVELKHRNSTMSPSKRGSDVAKELTVRKTLRRNSRSFSSRPSLSWFETQNWLDWAEVHRNGQVGTGRPLLPSIRDEFQRSKKVVSHIKQIGQECTDASSIRLPSRSHNQEPSPTRTRRRTCRTCSFTAISKMTPFFLKSFLVELAGGTHELNSMFFIYGSSFRLQLIAICCNRRNTPHTSLFLMQWTRTHCCTSHCMVHVICMVTHVCDLIICSLCSSLCSCPCFSPISSSSTWTLISSSMWT